MTDKEAMKLALDALEYHASQTRPIYQTDIAITVLKERLAQPHETTLKEFNQWIYDDPKYHIWAKEKEALADPMREVQRLGQEIEQEPPQRTWVGLTEQEHTDIAVECGCMSADWVFYGAAVERKVKERNT